MKRKLKLSIAGVLVGVLSMSLIGCTGNTTQTDEEDAKSVTINNYSVSSDGTTWSQIEQTYDSVPEKVVCNNGGIAEIMIRLGLKDKIVGVAAVFGEPEEDIAEDFNSLNIISESYASKEVVLGVNPDCVIGRGDLFVDGDYGIGTVTDLNSVGIATYIAETSTKNATYESFINDIENLGKIFHVEDKATELIEYYNDKIDNLKTSWGDKELVLAEVSVVEDGIPTFGSAATESLQNEALSMIGLTNINAETTGSEISIETVIEKNPDVIILFDYEGGPDMDTMIQSLYDNESLQDINAIKNKKVISTNFSEIYGGSGSLYTAMEKLAAEIYE